MNKKQALIIAQEQLKISDANKHFSSSSYKFINNKETRKYPYLFFISFEQNNPSSFFNIKFLVVINKKDNAIVYSGEWIPGKQTNFDWIYSQPDQKEDKLKKLKEKINELENKSK